MKKAVPVFIFIVAMSACLAVSEGSSRGREDAGMDRNDALARSNVESPFGVLAFLHWNHEWNNYKYPSGKELERSISLMKEAGVGWVRMDFLWQDIEPSVGVFEFEKYDTIVGLLGKYGINILGVLHYSTDWDSPSGKWNCPSADNKAFVDYAVRVAERYTQSVKYWEIWNEPDSSVYWEPQDGLKSYCILLKDVYTALKKAAPGCYVLNGGLANGMGSVNRLYENGAKDYFDILNLHIFDSPFNEGAIKRVLAYPKAARKIMERNNDAHKMIWVTEIGCPGVSLFSLTKNWWLGSNPREKAQAQWLRQVYTQLLKMPQVEKVFWAFWRDCKEHWKNGTDYFGLIRWDYSRKPGFRAYRECVDEYFSLPQR